MNFFDQTVVAFGVLFLSLMTPWADGPVADTDDSPKPFVREWRVVLTGREADGMNWATPGWQLDSRELSSGEIDAIEQRLLPALATDLKDAGSADLACDYHRQFATGRWKRYHIVLIHGFHRGYLAAPIDSVTERDRWKHEVMDATDGGTSFWDAVYIVELQKFAKMRQTGQTSHTVLFHGVA